MGIVFRQSVKSTIVTFTGAVLGAAIFYAYTFILSKQEIGIIRNILAEGTMVHLFVLMGIANLLSVYIPKYDENDERRKVLLLIGLFVPLVFTILYTIPYFLFKDQLVHLYQAQDMRFISSFYKWIPVLVLLMGYMTLLDHYLMTQLKIAVSAFTKDILLRLVNIISIVLYFFKIITFRMLVISNVLAFIVPVIVLFFIAKRTKGFGLSFKLNVFTKKEYRQIITFSWYHLLLGVTINVMGFLDPIMLAAMAKEGVSTLAVYTWALFIISVMVIPYRAMTNASYSVLNKAYIDKDNTKVYDLFHRSAINMLIMAVGVFLIIACNTDNLVAILPNGYSAIKPIVLILMIGRMVDMATGMNSELISFSKYYRFNFRISILLVIMLYLFNRLFIPKYGIYGAAWSATMALVIFNLGKMAFLYWKMKLQPFNIKSLFVVFSGLAAAIAGYYMPFIVNPFIDTIIRTLLIIIIYALMLVLLKPSLDLSTYIGFLKSNKKLY